MLISLLYDCQPFNHVFLNNLPNKKALCALAEVKFSPHHKPLPRGAGRPKFNQLEMVTTFTYGPSLVKIDACNFELSW